MALGKPVLCFLNDRFRPFHPEWEECPIVNADPDTLTDELRELALDPARRRELGARGPGTCGATTRSRPSAPCWTASTAASGSVRYLLVS